ncbi:MAG TPA: sulfurtransferase, partial [Bacteroidetes bacterium]|nr:sulfurtransferase [Bacteroidota bacterium]
LPVSSEVPAPGSAIFCPKEKKEWLVSVQQVEQYLDDPRFLLVDSRAAERYRGEREPIDPVAGHIPGAISAPFLENIGEDGLFLPKEKLEKRFDRIMGIHPPEQTIFYCGSGVTACHNLLALSHLGRHGAKLFPGSWSEWIAGKKRPVEKNS